MRSTATLCLILAVSGLPAFSQPLPDLHAAHFFASAEGNPAIPAPESVLGYRLGEQFSRHDEQIAYLRALDAASDRVMIRPYGRTVEGRPLMVLFISSPSNLRDLDAVLARNVRLADPALPAPERDAIIERNPMVAWLSYNVHGNEPSCAEAAIGVAHTLAASGGPEIDAILNNVVVVLDPMINPDGHDRYVNWYRATMGGAPDPSHEAAEHHEPWPGGRQNHYLFDLNRDWVWCVQPESRARLTLYRTILPQLHLDFHEQEFRNPYFLGLGDDPYNVNIPEATKEWVGRYGADAAATFDRYGLVYSTKERFDYLYPGYGKVLPCYHGAVGLLYEQGGHSFAGLSVEVDEHYNLTLAERVRNHMFSSFSGLAYSAANRKEQLTRFSGFFRESIEAAKASPETYFIDPATTPQCWPASPACARPTASRLKNSTAICPCAACWTTGPVSPGSSPSPRQVRDSPGSPQREQTQRMLREGTWVIRTDQPMGRLARALFERTPVITDRQTYDISSWSVPLSFGLEAWYSREAGPWPVRRLEFEPLPGGVVGDGDVAVIIDARQLDFPAAVGLAARAEAVCRFAGEDFQLEGRRFSRGSLILYRARNTHMDLEGFLAQVGALGLRSTRVGSGMTEEGAVLGAREHPALVLPRVALVRGNGVSAVDFGEVWHLLDVDCPMPHTLLNIDRIANADLTQFNVLVFTDGASASGAAMDKVKAWVASGGTLIALESASSWAAGTMLELEEPKDPGSLPARPEPGVMTHAERRERAIDDGIPGVHVRVDLDTTHPLTAGMGSSIAVIKSRDARQRVGRSSVIIGRYVSPAIGESISERNELRLSGMPAATVHALGTGRVICLGDSLTTRGFALAPRRLLQNAIMYGPSLGR
jgi:hypothetical protein